MYQLLRMLRDQENKGSEEVHNISLTISLTNFPPGLNEFHLEEAEIHYLEHCGLPASDIKTAITVNMVLEKWQDMKFALPSETQ